VEVVIRTLHRSPRRASAARSALVQLFALLVAVLALCAQQRVVRTVRLAPAATRVVGERPETIESNALRAESPPRVAPASVLARLPVFSPPVAGLHLPIARSAVPPSACVRRAQRVTHFHAKRRIPRMNSEEPPRALS
jgi:hypothetical protein